MLIYILAIFFVFPHQICASDKVHAEVTIYFSPNGGCEQAIINAIKNAKKSIYVQAYAFTSESIAEALATAKNQNIDVTIILDRSQLKVKGCKLNFFLMKKLKVFSYKSKGIQHSKMLIIDDDLVITGSYNFTKAAEESNSENLLVICSKELNERCKINFKKVLSKSTRIS